MLTALSCLCSLSRSVVEPRFAAGAKNEQQDMLVSLGVCFDDMLTS